MITDDQLIERLRCTMRDAAGDVFVPAELLDGIAPARGWRSRLPRPGTVATVAAACSTLAIAAVAIVLLGHARAPAPSVTARQPASRRPVVTLAGLRAELAILRRPQTATDRPPLWALAAEEAQRCSNCLNLARVWPRQTRLLATIGGSVQHRGRGRERVYLVLGTVPQSWAHGLSSGWVHARRPLAGLHLSLVGFTSRTSPAGQPADELLDYADQRVPASLLTPHDVLVSTLGTVGVVPDGVTLVRWQLANPGQGAPAVVYASVHGNVAVAPPTPAPPATRLLNEQLLVGATWYGADRHVISSFHVDMAQVDRAYAG